MATTTSAIGFSAALADEYRPMRKVPTAKSEAARRSGCLGSFQRGIMRRIAIESCERYKPFHEAFVLAFGSLPLPFSAVVPPRAGLRGADHRYQRDVSLFPRRSDGGDLEYVADRIQLHCRGQACQGRTVKTGFQGGATMDDLPGKGRVRLDLRRSE